MKNTDFIIGCNYWASNAGTEMWVQFDEKAIEKDIKILSEHGLNVIRAFPIWRDFQPAEPLFSKYGEVKEYTVNGKNPTTPTTSTHKC